MDAVWRMPGLPGHLKMVLLAMADHANDEGRCYPSQELIAEKTSQAERTVRHNQELLTRMGLVEVLARRRQAPQEYQLHIPTDPRATDWAALAARTRTDRDVTLQFGWFNQDRQPIAGQESHPIAVPDTGQDRQPVADNSPQDRQPIADQPESRPATQRHQDRQPVANKTGNPLPVSKEPPVEPPMNPHPSRSNRDEVWDALVERFYPSGVTARTTEKRVGRVVTTLAAAGATGPEIHRRADAWASLWARAGNARPTLTLEALEKWWDELGTTADTDPATKPPCATCDGRGIVVVLDDGRRVATTHDDAWQSDRTVRCECATGAVA